MVLAAVPAADDGRSRGEERHPDDERTEDREDQRQARARAVGPLVTERVRLRGRRVAGLRTDLGRDEEIRGRVVRIGLIRVDRRDVRERLLELVGARGDRDLVGQGPAVTDLLGGPRQRMGRRVVGAERELAVAAGGAVDVRDAVGQLVREDGVGDRVGADVVRERVGDGVTLVGGRDLGDGVVRQLQRRRRRVVALVDATARTG